MKRVRELSRCFMSQFSHHITGCLFQGSRRVRKMLSGYWKHIVLVLVLNAREQHRHNLMGTIILQCLFMVIFFFIIIGPNNQMMIFWGILTTLHVLTTVRCSYLLCVCYLQIRNISFSSFLLVHFEVVKQKRIFTWQIPSIYFAPILPSSLCYKKH